MSYALVLFLTSTAVLLSRLIGSKRGLPILTGIAVYFPFILEIQKSIWHGLALLAFWVLFQSLLVLILTWKNPAEMEALIWRAKEYTEAMFRWIETGELPEGNRKGVIRFHLKQVLMYVLLAAFTANLVSLMLGSALLNYMNYYVGRFAAQTNPKMKGILWGWNPWSIVRVVVFLYIGVVFALLSMSLLFAVEEWPTLEWIVPGLTGLALDLFLKLKLSKKWSQKLKSLLIY